MTGSPARPILLEVIVRTLDDARAAAEGGADRLEIVRAIRHGGLMPSVALVRAIAAETSLPLRVMVRENAGYDTDAAEIVALQRAATEFASLRVDGLVAGFARDGQLSLDQLFQMLQAAPHLPVTFHRAFDSLADPLGAIDVLAAVPQIDSILTSGGDAGAENRCVRLREYSHRAGSRLRVIAGSQVDERMLEVIRRTGCVREVHVGRAAREGHAQEGPVTAARVRRLREIIA